jgi:hypothetical protein
LVSWVNCRSNSEEAEKVERKGNLGKNKSEESDRMEVSV